MLSYGYSTALAPIHVKIMKVIIIYQTKIFWVGLNLEDKINFFFIGRIEMIRIAIINPITPPSLFGMDRKIAYANKKYHSG